MKREVTPNWQTGNVSIAAALCTLGFRWAHESTPCTNVYSKDDSIPIDREGCPKQPGNVTFFINQFSDAFPVELRAVLDQWRAPSADKELDGLISPKSGDSKEVAELKQLIREILPLALTGYMKGVLANRKEVAGAWRYVQPMRSYKDGSSTILISANASEKTKQDLGL